MCRCVGSLFSGICHAAGSACGSLVRSGLALAAAPAQWTYLVASSGSGVGVLRPAFAFGVWGNTPTLIPSLAIPCSFGVGGGARESMGSPLLRPATPGITMCPAVPRPRLNDSCAGPACSRSRAQEDVTALLPRILCALVRSWALYLRTLEADVQLCRTAPREIPATWPLGWQSGSPGTGSYAVGPNAPRGVCGISPLRCPSGVFTCFL